MTFPGSLQFFQNQISWLFQVSHTAFSDLHRHTHQYWKHAITEHQHKLSWHADFTISDDFVLWFFTLLSSTHFTCCLKYSFNYWHIFYPPMCNSLLFHTSQIILHFLWLSLTLTVFPGAQESWFAGPLTPKIRTILAPVRASITFIAKQDKTIQQVAAVCSCIIYSQRLLHDTNNTCITTNVWQFFQDNDDQNRTFSGPTADFRTSTGLIFFIFQDMWELWIQVNKPFIYMKIL